MASRSEEHQADICLQMFRLISKDPEMSSRQVADEVGIVNGSAYYVLTALVEKGFVKLGNFKNYPRQEKYAYPLIPKGIQGTSLLNHSFIERKHREFKGLKAEVQALKEEAGPVDEAITAPRDKH